MAHPKEFAEGLSIGIIMDGNGRWAKNRGLPRTAGHKKGAEVFSDIADYCDELGVSSVYFYAFSTENWKRPLEEVNAIMRLFGEYLLKGFDYKNRIFDMTLEGFGTEQIATQFEKEGILTPQAYWIQKGIGRPGKSKTRPATKWNGSTITHLLYQQEYCGDVLNFKTYSKSYKNKKRIHNDPENWVVFQDVHEPIIERAVFEQVQQKRGKMRKRRTSNGEHNMFSGLLVCADCGCNLHFHFNQGNPEIKYFNCSNYKGNRGTCQSTHYIRVDFLEEVVLGEIRRLTKFASLYEDDFLKAIIGHSQQADEAGRKLKEKELKALLARDEELDGLFERIYEDNVSGKISDERFSRMSRRYEDEQKELTEKIKQLRSEIEKQSSRTMTTDMFIRLVRKYTRAKKLTPRMLNELVEKIEVFNAEKVNGVWEQRLRIHYNCVGRMQFSIHPVELRSAHPNTAVLTLTSRTGRQLSLKAASVGGGRIRVTEIDGVPADFGGDSNTLIIHNEDTPGCIAEVTMALALRRINIASMQVFRAAAGGYAVMVLECDSHIPHALERQLAVMPGLLKVTCLNVDEPEETEE